MQATQARTPVSGPRDGAARTAGRVLLGAFLTFTGTGHLTALRQEFQAQVPPWIPIDPDLVVVASGVAEVGLGAALILAPRALRPAVGWATAAFFVVIFPGNISQYLTGTDAFGLTSDNARLVRLFFQPVLVVWALWATGAWRARRTPGGTPDSDAGRAASFTIEVATPVTPDEALRRVLDLRAHDRVIPLTRVRPAVPATDLHPGSSFVARTGVGPLGFDDPMRVEAVDEHGAAEPAGAVIVKEGHVIQGRIEVLITPTAAGSLLSWHQQVALPWLPGFLQAPAARVLRRGYRRVLTRLLGRPRAAGPRVDPGPG